MNSIVLTRAFVVIDALDKTGKAYTSVMSRFTGLASRIAGIGARLSASMIMPTVALKRVLDDYVKFEDQMLSLKAITGSNRAEFERMCGVARRFGKEVTFSVQQVAEAMTEMGRAGFSTKQIEESFQSVLDFARATKIELKESADFISSTLKTFSAGPEFARQIADSLTAAANSSAVTPREIMSAMRMSASIMAQVGMDVKDYLEAIGALGNFGIRGTLAGTVMRRAGTKLANEGMIQQFQNVGVKVYDERGNMRNLIEVLSEYRSALRQRRFTDNQIIARLSSQSGFGMYGAAGIIALSNAADAKGNRKFQELKDALDGSAGLASIVAAEMDSGIGGAIRYLVASLQELNIVLGQALAPMVKNFASQIKGWTNAASIFFEKNQGLVTSAATAFVGLTALGTAMFVVGTAAMPLVSTLGMIGEAFVGLTGVLSTSFGYLNVMVAEYTKGFMGGLRYAGTALENRQRLFTIDEINEAFNVKSLTAEQAEAVKLESLARAKVAVNEMIEEQRLKDIAAAQSKYSANLPHKFSMPVRQPERRAMYDFLNRLKFGQLTEEDLKIKDFREILRPYKAELKGLTPEKQIEKLYELAGNANKIMANRNAAAVALDENYKVVSREWVDKKTFSYLERPITEWTAPDNRDYYFVNDEKTLKRLRTITEKNINPLATRIAKAEEDMANFLANRRIGGEPFNLRNSSEVQSIRGAESKAITAFGRGWSGESTLRSARASSIDATMLTSYPAVENARRAQLLEEIEKQIQESGKGRKLFKEVKAEMVRSSVASEAQTQLTALEEEYKTLGVKIKEAQAEKEGLLTQLRETATKDAEALGKNLEAEKAALEAEKARIAENLAKNQKYISDGVAQQEKFATDLAKKQVEKADIKNQMLQYDKKSKQYEHLRDRYNEAGVRIENERAAQAQINAEYAKGKRVASSEISADKIRLKAIDKDIARVQKAQADLGGYVERMVKTENDAIRTAKATVEGLENQQEAIGTQRKALAKVASGESVPRPLGKGASARITSEDVMNSPAYKTRLAGLAEEKLAERENKFNQKLIAKANKEHQQYSRAVSKIQTKVQTALQDNTKRALRNIETVTNTRDNEISNANKLSIKREAGVAKEYQKGVEGTVRETEQELASIERDRQALVKANGQVEQATPWWGSAAKGKGKLTNFDKMRRSFSKALEYGSAGNLENAGKSIKTGFSRFWKGTSTATKGLLEGGSLGSGLMATLDILKSILNIAASIGSALFKGRKAFFDVKNAGTIFFNFLNILSTGFNVAWGMIRSSWLIALEVFVRVLYYGNLWKVVFGALVAVVALAVMGFMGLMKVMEFLIVTVSKFLANVVKGFMGLCSALSPLIVAIGGVMAVISITTVLALKAALEAVFNAFGMLCRWIGQLGEAIGRLFGLSIKDNLEGLANAFLAPISRAFSQIKSIFTNMISECWRFIRAGDTETAFKIFQDSMSLIWVEIQQCILDIQYNLKDFLHNSKFWFGRLIGYCLDIYSWLTGSDNEREAYKSGVAEYASLSQEEKNRYRARYGVHDAEEYGKFKGYVQYLWSQKYANTNIPFQAFFERIGANIIGQGNDYVLDQYMKGQGHGQGIVSLKEYMAGQTTVADAEKGKAFEYKRSQEYAEYDKKNKALAKKRGALQKSIQDDIALGESRLAYKEQKDNLVQNFIDSHLMKTNGMMMNEKERTSFESLMRVAMDKANLQTLEDWKRFSFEIGDALNRGYSVGNFAQGYEGYIARMGGDRENATAFLKSMKDAVAMSAPRTGRSVSVGEDGAFDVGYEEMGIGDVLNLWSPRVARALLKEGKEYAATTIESEKLGISVTKGLQYNEENRALILEDIYWKAEDEIQRLQSIEGLTAAQDKRLGDLMRVRYNLRNLLFEYDEREGGEFIGDSADPEKQLFYKNRRAERHEALLKKSEEEARKVFDEQKKEVVEKREAEKKKAEKDKKKKDKEEKETYDDEVVSSGVGTRPQATSKYPVARPTREPVSDGEPKVVYVKAAEEPAVKSKYSDTQLLEQYIPGITENFRKGKRYGKANITNPETQPGLLYNAQNKEKIFERMMYDIENDYGRLQESINKGTFEGEAKAEAEKNLTRLGGLLREYHKRVLGIDFKTINELTGEQAALVANRRRDFVANWRLEQEALARQAKISKEKGAADMLTMLRDENSALATSGLSRVSETSTSIIVDSIRTIVSEMLLKADRDLKARETNSKNWDNLLGFQKTISGNTDSLVSAMGKTGLRVEVIK